jgi:RHS repeat-associated protein
MTRGGDAIYRYDANGNRIAKEDAGLYRYHTEHPDVSYQYDYEDRLIRIVEQQLHPGNRTAHGEDPPAGLSRKPALQFVTEYRYDAAGRRVEKHTGPSFNGMLEGTIDDVRFEQVRYLYDGIEVLHEHSSRQDHQTIAFYRAGGRLVAQFRYSTSYNFSDGQTPRMYLDYYSHDGLGSVATLTHYEDDENHQPIRYRYSAFGAIVQGDFTNNPYGYTSRRFDHENGFYHYHFRKYDPVTGNWLTPDPIGIAGGINLYRFVGNNPVNYRDWLGLWSDKDDWGGDGPDGWGSDGWGDNGGGWHNPGEGDGNGSCGAQQSWRGIPFPYQPTRVPLPYQPPPSPWETDWPSSEWPELPPEEEGTDWGKVIGLTTIGTIQLAYAVGLGVITVAELTSTPATTVVGAAAALHTAAMAGVNAGGAALSLSEAIGEILR